MQSIPQRQPRERLQLPGRSSLSLAGDSRTRRSSNCAVPSPRPRSVCTCSNHPGATRCSRHGYLVPREKSRNGNKEVIRRALTPAKRRLSRRWWNFRPTPSRLSNMSMA